MAKAARKHKVEFEQPELNLNPMMDLFAVLIPALLMMSAVVEVTTLNVSAPAIGGGDAAPPPDKPPLNLTVSITDQGYIVAGAGGVLAGPGATPVASVPGQGPTIPLVQKTIGCSRYRDSWPPPRAKNRAVAACTDPSAQRPFWIYDLEALIKKVVAIKDAFPDERRIIVQAEPQVEFESIIDVMDATRDIRDPGGETRILFDEVVLSPGMG